MNKRIKKKQEQQQIKVISKNLKRKYNVKGIETPKYAKFEINNAEITVYANTPELKELNNKLVVKFNGLEGEYFVDSLNKSSLTFIYNLLGEDLEYHLGKAVKGQKFADEDSFTKKQYIKEGQKKIKEIEKNNAKIEKNISKLIEKLNSTKNVKSVKVLRNNKVTDLTVTLDADLKDANREKLTERILNNVSKVKETLVEIHSINITVIK